MALGHAVPSDFILVGVAMSIAALMVLVKEDVTPAVTAPARIQPDADGVATTALGQLASEPLGTEISSSDRPD